MICQLNLGGGIINKQQFITQTLIFIANSIFINVFAKVFGMSNSIVAVAIVVIALSLVAIDLRENLFKKTFFISIVMLVMGIGATVSNINPIIGIVVNLLIIFFIAYEGMNIYKENMYFPFLLGYIFMNLSAPVKVEQLPLRVISLVVGCLYILVIQLVLNKDRFNKTVVHTKKQIFNMVNRRIDEVLEGSTEKLSYKGIYALTKPIIKAIYDTRGKGKVVSAENKGRLELVLAMESIYKAVSNFSGRALEEDERDLLLKIKSLIKELDDYFYSSNDKGVIKKNISLKINEISASIKDESLANLKETIVYINEAIELFESNNNEDEHIKGKFKSIRIDTCTFKFAVKLTVTVSTIIFLTHVFNLDYGRWIVFPAIAIIQPYTDGTVKKAMDRVKGTIIGIVFFVIIFTFVKDNMVRLNITIFLAYINLFIKKYSIYTSLIAVSALGSVAMGGAGIEILVLRLAFTILGCVIGILVNKYIFTYNLKEYKVELKDEYNLYKEQIKTPTITETEKYDTILKIKLLEYRIEELTSN